jgi:hypothetical protein
MYFWNWLKGFIATASRRNGDLAMTHDLSKHRVHTIKYEDLCM